MPFRLDCQRDRQRRRRTVEQQIAKLDEGAAERRLVAVVETGHAAYLVPRYDRSKLELHVLIWRELIFEFRLDGAVAAVAPAETTNRIGREFPFAFEADAGPFGKSKDVFGLDLAIAAVRSRGVPRIDGQHGERDAKYARNCRQRREPTHSSDPIATRSRRI